MARPPPPSTLAMRILRSTALPIAVSPVRSHFQMRFETCSSFSFRSFLRQVEGPAPGRAVLVGVSRAARQGMVGDLDQVAAAEAAVGIAPMHGPHRRQGVAGPRRIVGAVQEPPGDGVFQRVAAAIGVFAERALPAGRIDGRCRANRSRRTISSGAGQPRRRTTWRYAPRGRWWHSGVSALFEMPPRVQPRASSAASPVPDRSRRGQSRCRRHSRPFRPGPYSASAPDRPRAAPR